MRSDEFHSTALELDREGRAYAIVTVLRTQGSSSAKAGAKAIIDSQGKTLYGWVGGGCTESDVREAALEALKQGAPSTLTVDLTNETTGVPCGGTMELFLEPIFPAPHLQLVGRGKAVEALVKFGRFLGFRISVFDPGATPETYPQADHLFPKDLTLDHLQGGPNTFVVVATHHKHDHEALSHCLKKNVEYIGLIASQHRTQLILNDLHMAGLSKKELAKLKAPAGLDLGGQTPEEIALSIISEIVSLHRKGSALPLSSLHQKIRLS